MLPDEKFHLTHDENIINKYQKYKKTWDKISKNICSVIKKDGNDLLLHKNY